MLALSSHILFGLQLESPKKFRKALVIVMPFLPSKGTTNHA